MGAMYYAKIPTHPFEKAASVLTPFAFGARFQIGDRTRRIQLRTIRLWCHKLSTHSEANVRCVVGASTSPPASWASQEEMANTVADPQGRSNQSITSVLYDVVGGGVSRRLFVGSFRPRRGLNVQFSRKQGGIVPLNWFGNGVGSVLGILLAYEVVPSGSFVSAEIGGLIGYEDLD